MESQTMEDALGNTFVIIPMLNEQDSIGLVLADLPEVREVIVVDNGSTDDSAAVAASSGATVVSETRRGYGQACLTGIEHVVAASSQDATKRRDQTIVVFMDGDYSDHPTELPDVIRPLIEANYDFVIGSRALGQRESRAMHIQALLGNWLACSLMRVFWGAKFTDLGPFRAIRLPSLLQLAMQDTNFGWTIEMQIKAVQNKLKYREVAVSYRRRIGTSKISGTISGTCRAGYKILYTIFRYRFQNP